MNKILNWTFGACFRTLGRFLAIFLILALFLFIGSKLDIELPDWLRLRVNAATVENWTLGLDGLNEVYMYDCTSSNNCSNNISVGNFNVYGTDRYYVNTTGSQPPLVYTNGILMQVSESKTYMKGYLYSVNMYVCTSSFATTPTRTLFSTTWADRTTGISTDAYNSVTNVYSMNKQPFANVELTFDSCHAVSSIFSPSKNTTSIIYRFKTPNQSQRIDFSIIGLKVENLGVYDKSLVNQIDEIIDNSGYATAESVAQVNTAVNQVKQEVQELNNSIDETNDIISDNTSPDVSGMTDLAGYLPPGPLDSVLNLPLSILNSLNSKLSSSCTPLSLTLPFVNLSLNIPCISTIFNQINGLNVLWDSIGVILGALIMYSYLTYLYNWVDDVTSLRHNKARLFGAKSDADNWGGVD